MLAAYESLLARRPLLIKSFQGCVLGGCGDFTAQRLEGGAYNGRRACRIATPVLDSHL